ncbi:hypothetical protein [Paractinoplanes brasiliensis]|uniref:Uncharacterized protein n=1 Tax=Paractinoplanes brasiliensis TaxID=52695 RepID=A0A4R6JAK3_9ACTN|nr:hypothetical protein [Actinoplanes brasiliensis]TDO31495.1 hypothetical protein C8E87_6919 [Actinoplanes brasiliensis]GID30891.1 hypothetical protein Abr02nite_58740 [Actinoplanes brasiliensis]
MRRPAVALLVLLTLAACGDGGGPESLPSPRPSAERTTSPRPTDTRDTADPTRTPDRTRGTADPTRTPDRTRETAEPDRTPDRTEATAEPDRTRETADPTPTLAGPPPPPAATTPPAAATTQPPPAATTPPLTAAATPAQEPTTGPTPSAAAATTDSGGFGILGWVLLFVVLGLVAAFLLINRSRRAAAWRTEAATLTAQTRTATDLRVPSVLAQRGPAERSLSWPPVRDELALLATRWADLATRAPETASQAAAAQVAGILQDLIAAMDALVIGGDERAMRTEVTVALDALTAALPPPVPVTPAPPPSPSPGQPPPPNAAQPPPRNGGQPPPPSGGQPPPPYAG